LELQRPLAYQEIAGERRNVEAAYTLSANHRVAFSFGAYDSSKPLVVDPVLNYSTYLGGSGDDLANAIAVDALGDAFVAGGTFSNDFPTKANGRHDRIDLVNPSDCAFRITTPAMIATSGPLYPELPRQIMNAIIAAQRTLVHHFVKLPKIV